MKLQQIIRGNGAVCGYCGKIPNAKYTVYYGRDYAYFAWACNEDHAKRSFTI